MKAHTQGLSTRHFRRVAAAIALAAFVLWIAGPAFAQSNLVSNPGFESGASSWTQVSTFSGAPIINSDATAAHSGSGFAWLGGYVSGTDTLSQDIAIPAGAGQAQLSFWYRLTTDESMSGAAYDTMQVSVVDASSGNSTVLAAFSNLDATSGWVQSRGYDVSAYRGRTVRLAFSATNDFSNATSLRLDDISLTTSGSSGSSPPSTNYSDIWYNSDESGWGLTIADHETQLFAVWYTYRADGRPTWFFVSGGTFTENRRFFTGTLYQATGPGYDAATFNPELVGATPVGSVSIDFAPPGVAPGRALFTFTVGGITRTRQIERQPFGNAMPNWGTDYTDIWWYPAESGWGLTLAQHGNNVFGVLFTYDTDGQPLFVVLSGVTFDGPNSFSGPLYTTTGPYFGNATFDSTQVQVRPVGSASISFSGRSGTFRSTINGVTRTRPLAQQPFGRASPAPSGAPLAIAAAALPAATAGTYYSARAATATGGSPPYHFQSDTFANGTPPPGMIVTLDGFLQGTPSSTITTARSYTFGICVADIVAASTCTQATVTVSPSAPALNGTMKWTVGNQCSSTSQVDYKLHDRANQHVWPGASTHYVVPYGQTVSNTLSCVAGAKVCIGGQSGSLTWGVGLAGSSSCTNCCYFCDGGTHAYSFGCSSSPGTFYYANWTCGGSGQCAAVMGGSAGSKGPMCSLADCQAWGNRNIPAGYSCSTQPTYAPNPGGSQCLRF
jgi:hypothetical protein